MKLMIRLSVVGLVLAGAAASAFTAKTPASSTAVASHNTLVISGAVPIPSCSPHDGCI